MANVNALAFSMGIDDMQSTTMELYEKENVSGDENRTYMLGDNMLLVETSDTSNKELKEIKVMCMDKSLIWIRLAEAAYVAAIKAVNPEFTGEDFSAIHDELFSEDESKMISYKKIFYVRYINDSGIVYVITVK